MAAEVSLITGWERLLLAALGGSIGVVLGFALNEWKNWWTRKRKHQGFWRGLEAEIEFCRGRAEGFLAAGVQAPLYQLPDSLFKTCFPELLADGAMKQDESIALMTFYAEVATLNRGLDEGLKAESDERRASEYRRNQLKAERLVGTGSAYLGARSALDRHVKGRGT